MILNKKIITLGLTLGLVMPVVGLFVGLQISTQVGTWLAAPFIMVAKISGTPLGNWMFVHWAAGITLSVLIWILIAATLQKLIRLLAK